MWYIQKTLGVIGWWRSRHITPKYSTLTYSVFQAEGIWEMACTGWISDFSLKLIITLSRERCALPIPGGKAHPSIWRERDPERNLNEQALLSFPSLLHLVHLFMAIHSSPNLAWKHRELSFFKSSCPYQVLISVKFTVSSFACFSPINLLCQFNSQT